MKTVLDLGAYSGVASNQFVEPGDRWILVDNGEWKKYGWGDPAYLPDAEVIDCDIMDYHEPAEIVVCSNVLYHHPDPWAFIAHLRKLTLETLVLTTYFDEGEKAEWHFYDKDVNPCHPDPKTAATIFYRPTIKALTEELRKVGFKIDKIEKPDGVTVTCSVKEN